LLLTMYQLCGSSPSIPCTSQVVRWVRPIQALLPQIQASAINSRMGSMARRTGLKGRMSLSIDTISRMGTQNSALTTISSVAIRKTRGEGR
jgi:hypothetical protein